jgi:membrane protease YdiL (CAAX protease family)
MQRLRVNPGLSALLEVGLLFTPAIPAYIWLWPAVRGGDMLYLVQSLVYLYFLAGCLIIGLRRWSLSQLGLNRQGIWLSLACGVILIAAFMLGRLAIDLPMNPRPLTIERLVGEMFFYFLLVGLVEELLFRGLIYRAFEAWRGTGMAIFGSALAFGLFHIGWAGGLGMLGLAFIGLLFALIRWRAGGICGLILVHGLYDILSVELYPDTVEGGVISIVVQHRSLVILADLLILVVLLYLWKIHPRLQHQGV